MRIGIDISQTVYGTGVGDYTKNLVDQLLKIDTENDYILFGGSLRRKTELAHLFNYPTKIFPLPPTAADILWNRWHVFPIEKLIGPLDVFHSSDWTQPPSHAYKVTTLHDLAPLRFPEDTPKKVRDAHQARLGWVTKEVDKVIAVSSFTKQEAVELLNIDPERIVVIPEAGDERIKRVEKQTIEEVKNKFKVQGAYLLVVGTSKRKNLDRIIQAFEKLRGLFDFLVIVGTMPQGILSAKNIIYTGFVDFYEISALYSGAEALVYASLYEGFGQPILEGMKVGIPVVTSNLSSMPEIAGGAAVLVDPRDVDSIVQGVKDATKNRGRLIKKGVERVKEFSWIDTAKLTLRIYKDAQKNK